MKHRLILPLAIGLLCVGCATDSAATSPASALVPTKVAHQPPDSLVLPSGYSLALQGGLTDAGRSQLEADDTGYFVLAFAAPPDAAVRQALSQAGVQLGDVLGPGVYLATVAPTALPVLEEQAAAGMLRLAGPLPAEAKLSSELADKLVTIASDERLDVVVHLFAPPTAAQRSELTRWLRIKTEAPGPVYLVEGNIESQHIADLLALPLVRLVEELELSTPGG